MSKSKNQEKDYKRWTPNKSLSSSHRQLSLKLNTSLNSSTNNKMTNDSGENYGTFRRKLFTKSQQLSKGKSFHSLQQQMKEIFNQFLAQLRQMINQIAKEFQRVIANTMRKIRKDLEQFRDGKWKKSQNLTTRPSQQSQLKLTQQKSQQKFSFGSSPHSQNKFSFKNPIKLKNQLQKNSRVSFIKRQKMQNPQKHSASKEILKLQQKLSSLKHFLK